MEKGLERAAELADRGVFQLELASTLLYWHRNSPSWEEAEAITEQSKKEDRGSDVFKSALKIANDVWQHRWQAES